MSEAETQRLARLYERKHAALEAVNKLPMHQALPENFRNQETRSCQR